MQMRIQMWRMWLLVVGLSAAVDGDDFFCTTKVAMVIYNRTDGMSMICHIS